MRCFYYGVISEMNGNRKRECDMSMKRSIKEEREDKGMERGLAFLGYLALLGLICWQYFNLTRGGPVLAVTAAGILGVVAGRFAVGNTRYRSVHFLFFFFTCSGSCIGSGII